MGRDGSSVTEERAFGNSDVGRGRVGIGFVGSLLGSREGELTVYRSFYFRLQIRSARPHSERAALADGDRSLVGECACGGEALPPLDVKAALGRIGHKASKSVGVGI